MMRDQMVAEAAWAHHHSYNGWTKEIEAKHDPYLFAVLVDLELDGVIEMVASYVEPDYNCDPHNVSIRLARDL